MMPSPIDYKRKVREWVTKKLGRTQGVVEILDIVAEAAEEIEQVFLGIARTRNIDGATGDALTLWGKIVDVSRDGRGDDVLRRIIGATVMANSSGGTPEELIAIVKKITDADNVKLIEMVKAVAFVIEGSTIPDGLRREIKRILQGATLGGELADYIVEADENTFRFEQGPQFDGGVFGRPF